MAKAKMLKVKLVRSVLGHKPSHIACAKGLGLRRINHVVERSDTPENRGMIDKIAYLLEVEEVA